MIMKIYKEEQIIKALKRIENGELPRDLCRELRVQR